MRVPVIVPAVLVATGWIFFELSTENKMDKIFALAWFTF